jgi:hypothetical protein
MSELTAQDLEVFARLGITPGVLKVADVERVTDAEARERFGIVYDGSLAGILFPYGRNGHRVTCRLRRDHPSLDTHGRPIAKYISPRGDNRHAYIYPDSDELLKDANVPAVVVEAEKSVLSVVAWSQRMTVKLLPIGIGGCQGFNAKRGHKTMAAGGHEPQKGLLPELDFLKDGRLVAVIFDANSATNRKVLIARNNLVKQLQQQGARVQVVSLPVMPNVNGVDDYIGVAGDAKFLALLNAPPAKPIVLVDPGGAGAAADLAERELVQHSEALQIFERAGQVVRIVTLREPEVSGGLQRPVGTTLIEPLSQYQVLEALESLCDFKKSTKSGKMKSLDCPTRVASFYLGRTGSRLLPVLTGTVMAPFMRDDGTVVASSGFDEETGLFLVSTETWLPVPESPTREAALESLAVLMAPFSEFPFVSAVHRSILLAGLLTALQRRLLPTSPLFGFSAPKQREGKSMLCDALAILATGRCAPCQALSREHEEVRKMIFTTLMEGHAAVNLDNLEKPLKSDHLSIALTQETYSDRILGSSQKISLSTRVLWTTSGCNLSFRGDLAVRVLICKLDSKREHPEERNFKIPDLQEYLKAHRPEMVRAALVILRAHHLHRDETPKMLPWGGFDRWSQAIRGPITWLGLDDPAETRREIVEDDPDQATGVALLRALEQAYGSEPFLMSKALELSKTDLALEQAFRGIAERNGHVDKRAVGWWSRRWKDRIADGLCLREAEKDHGVVRWKITTD